MSAVITRTRTPKERRADWCDHVAQSDYEYYADGLSRRQSVYDDSYADAERDWDAAVRIWNETAGTEDGDEKFCAVEAKFPGRDLSDAMLSMECDLGRVG